MLDAASWRKLVQFEDSKGHDEAKLRESTRKAVNEIFLCHRTQVCPGAHGSGNLPCGDSVELASMFFSFFLSLLISFICFWGLFEIIYYTLTHTSDVST